MTTRTDTNSLGVLGALSPQMAQDIGEAFSLERIGRLESPDPKKSATPSSRRALRLASRAAAMLLVTVVAVALSLAALVLVQL